MKIKSSQNQLDLVTLVNESDQVVGTMDKIEAHRGEAKLHRAISTFLFRKTDDGVELLMQQRSAKKIVGAHQWANTACGNVRPTENYQECAYRRLREELGITNVSLTPLNKFEYHLQCNDGFSEWEMDQVFAGWYDGEVVPNPEEVHRYRWVSWDKLINENTKTKVDPQKFNTKYFQSLEIVLAAWSAYMLDHPEIMSSLHDFVKKGD